MNKIYVNGSNKFKSTLVSINYLLDVNKEEISYFSVLASLLGKYTKRFKSPKEIEKHLMGLYNAIFDINTQKVGDLYNIEFRIEFVNKRFLPDNVDLFDDCLEFLKEVIYNPNLEFEECALEREKKAILDKINQRKDDKLYYGMIKSEEMIFENEVAGMYVYGDENVVKNIDASIIKKSYEKLINDSAIQVVITGNLEEYTDVEKKVENVFGQKLDSKYKIEDLIVNKNDNKMAKTIVRESVEEIESTQSVLALALRVVNPSEEDYYVLTLYNAILGGTPSSKLFQNFREKESLAYMVNSRYYRFKSVIIISSAISRKNYEKAISVIKKQIKDIEEGNISKEEFEASKQSVLSNITQWMDSKISMSKLFYSNLIHFKSCSVTLNDMYEKFKNINVDDIARIAKKIKLEEIILLGGELDA